MDGKLDLDVPPNSTEIRKSIDKMKPGKAPGSDGIPAKSFRDGGEVVRLQLQSLFNACWDRGTIPQDLRDTVISPLYKNKGTKSDCSNYRGIALLSVARKILARVLLNRLISTLAEDNTPESQCGFHANGGTTDMIFVFRQIQEKWGEQNMALYATFIGRTKAFDIVSREGPWNILERLGCPPTFLTIIKKLHEGQVGQVKLAGTLSDTFPISNGVKQGCILAPTLFSIFFSMILREAKEDIKDGIFIRFRTAGSIFNLHRLLAQTKTLEQMVLELLFADDCALIALTEKALQRTVNCFRKAATAFGLTISLKKTEVIYQSPPGESYSELHITIDNTKLNAVENFTYLGSVMSNDATINLDNRLSKASSSFGRLTKRVWQDRYHSPRLYQQS